ncbi:MAG: TonB-dependent receptor [Campylobacter sp.]|nr:TonB-dependent receptor [Campylobacter sp.]
MQLKDCFLVSSLCMAVALNASDSSTTSVNLEEVNVASSFIDTEIDRSVIITKDEIQDRGYTNISEVLSRNANISTIDGRIDMRGQGINDGGVGSTRAVKLMLDGVDTSRMVGHGHVDFDSLVDIDEIEQIEILPGGGAVRYGSGTRGGAINIITKIPTKDKASITLKGNTFGQSQHGGSVGVDFVKLLDENIGIKLNVLGFNEDGYRKYVNDKGYRVKTGIFGKIADTTRYDLSFDYLKDQYAGSDSLNPSQYEADRRQNTKHAHNTLRRQNVNGKVTSDISDNFRIEGKGFYRKEKDVQSAQNSFITDEVWGGELTGKYAYMSDSFLLFGYGFEKHKSLTAYSSGSLVDYIKNTHSLFAIDEHKFADVFSLASGVRYERADYTYNYFMGSTKKSTNTEKKSNNFAFEISPKVHYSDTGTVYAKFIHGFITPKPNEYRGSIKKNGVTTYFISDLKAEKYNTYEIGLNDDFSFTTLDVAAFFTRTKDEISSVGGSHGGASLSYYYNVGDTDRYGVELVAKQNVGDFEFKEGFTWLDTEIKSGENKGKEVPYVSNYKANLGLAYSFVKSFKALVDFTYNSKSYDNEYERIKAYSLVDLGLVYAPSENLKFKAGVKNLFDKKYLINQTSGTPYKMMGMTIDPRTKEPGDGRNFYLEVKYTF